MTGTWGRADAARPVLTLLYVPADQPARIAKALASAADVVIIDLEDAVAPQHKRAGRDALARVVHEHPGRPVQVRVNGIGTPWHDDDLDAVAGLPGHVGLRLPKVTAPQDVTTVALAVGDRGIHVLLENAAGVEAASDIARAHPRVASLGLGEADLRSDLGVDDDAGLAYARSRVVVAARAAGLGAPAMSVHPHVHDDDGLALSCAAGRSLGFLGRAAIHPRQLPVIERAFRPSPEEVARAARVLDAVAGALDQGRGTVVLADGSFLDAAMVERARTVVALGARTRSAGPSTA